MRECSGLNTNPESDESVKNANQEVGESEIGTKTDGEILET